MFKVIVEKKDSVETVYIYGERSLLSELEDENIQVDYSCRQGHCGCCILNLIEGEVSQQQEPLVPLAQGEILACQTVPITHLKLAFRD